MTTVLRVGSLWLHFFAPHLTHQFLFPTQEHPYPRAAMLMHVAALEGKEREDAETFIADNKLYKTLGK